MEYKWLQKSDSKKLILFFNGWSCDEQPFKTVGSDGSDVLMVYDYRDLTLPKQVIESIYLYETVSVIAWSFGVWVAQLALYPLKNMLTRTIAVNGTVKPVDKYFGIPAPIAMGTLSGLNDRNLEKFQRRMFSEQEQWECFNQNKPLRPFDEVKNELFLLLQHFRVQRMKDDFYDTALISRSDLIFPSANQYHYWEGKADIIELNHGHFCFYGFDNWEELVHLIKL